MSNATTPTTTNNIDHNLSIFAMVNKLWLQERDNSTSQVGYYVSGESDVRFMKPIWQ